MTEEQPPGEHPLQYPAAPPAAQPAYPNLPQPAQPAYPNLPPPGPYPNMPPPAYPPAGYGAHRPSSPSMPPGSPVYGVMPSELRRYGPQYGNVPPPPAFAGGASDRRLRTSRVIATIAQVALVLPVIAQVWVGHAIDNQRDALRTALDELSNTGTFDKSAADHADHVAGIALLLWAGSLLVAGAVLVWWLWRMREDADWFDPYIARRAKGWVIGGWIVPIVSFWFPYQVVGDVAKANQPLPTGYDDRQVPATVKLWWAAFLAMLVLERIVGAESPSTVGGFDTQAKVAYASAVVTAIAAVLAALMINMITNSNAERWRALRAAQGI